MMSEFMEEYVHRVVMYDKRYACSNQLITVVEAMEYDFALWLIKNRAYSRLHILERKRYWKKIGMPTELKSWFLNQENPTREYL